MAYEQKIQRFQRMNPDINTEWGTYENPNILFHPDTYKFRQPGVPNIAQSSHDVMSAMPRRDAGIGGLGYVGDYVPGPMGQLAPTTTGILGGDTLKTLLIVAAIGLVLYVLLRKEKLVVQSNPSSDDDDELVPATKAKRKRRRCGMTRDGRKRLSNFARRRPVDANGRFLPLK